MKALKESLKEFGIFLLFFIVMAGVVWGVDSCTRTGLGLS